MLPLNFSPSKFFQRVTRFLKWFPTFALNQIAKHSTLHSSVPFILHKVVVIRSKLLSLLFGFSLYNLFTIFFLLYFLIKSNTIFFINFNYRKGSTVTLMHVVFLLPPSKLCLQNFPFTRDA